MQRIRIMVDDEPEPAVHFLTEQQGKAIQEILNRYLDQLRHETGVYKSITNEVDHQGVKDIEYVTGLAKLFD